MSWTQDQLNRIFNGVWERSSATCPDDDAQLEVRRVVKLKGYVILVNCPRCGERVQMTQESDPRQKQFKPWSDEDVGTIVKNFFAHDRSDCPCCEAALELHSIRTLGTVSQIMCHCPRCGNSRTAKGPF